MSYDNNMKGMLSRNDRKQNPNHPDFRGTCTINGVEYWIDGWTKDGKPGGKMEGRKYFSLSFKPKNAPPAEPAPAATASEEDQDIPF